MGASLMNFMSAMRTFIINIVILATYVLSARLFQLWDGFEMMRTWLYGFLLLLFGQFVLFIACKRPFAAVAYIFGAFVVSKLVISSGAMGYNGSISTGSSNFPSIREGDLVIAKSFDVKYHRGAMVAVNIDGEQYRKRIHGLPHDNITICDGMVFVNGFTYHHVNKWVGLEFDHPSSCMRQYRKLQLSENEFFVLGDNHNNSFDSRNFGPVQKNTITMNYLYVLNGNTLRNTSSLTANFTQPKSNE